MQRIIHFFVAFLGKKERFSKGAAILTITTFLSYVTGLLRDRIFAHTFGASRELDIYNASFIIPDLVLNILVSSALSAAFIPLFTTLLSEGDREKAHALANNVMNTAVAAMVVFGGLAALFMPFLARFIVPGFSDFEREIFISLSRLMVISPMIMALSSSCGAILIGSKKFLAYGLSPIFYNLGIVAGALTAPWFGVYGLVFGTLVGALLHLAPRFAALAKSGFRYVLQLNIRDANFLKVIKLMIPKMIGHPVEQLTFLAFTRIATRLAAGSVTAISFARNFQSVPVALFGIAFSVAIFPTIAASAAVGDGVGFIKQVKKTALYILLFTIPSALGLYFLSDLPIRIFLGGGKFIDENILRTAQVLSVFALSIPTESLVHLLARGFYALKNTWIPVALSVVGFVIAVDFAYVSISRLGIIAIPYGFFLGSLIEVLLLIMTLRIKMRKTFTFSTTAESDGPPTTSAPQS